MLYGYKSVWFFPYWKPIWSELLVNLLVFLLHQKLVFAACLVSNVCHYYATLKLSFDILLSIVLSWTRDVIIFDWNFVIDVIRLNPSLYFLLWAKWTVYGSQTFLRERFVRNYGVVYNNNTCKSPSSHDSFKTVARIFTTWTQSIRRDFFFLYALSFCNIFLVSTEFLINGFLFFILIR